MAVGGISELPYLVQFPLLLQALFLNLLFRIDLREFKLINHFLTAWACTHEGGCSHARQSSFLNRRLGCRLRCLLHLPLHKVPYSLYTVVPFAWCYAQIRAAWGIYSFRVSANEKVICSNRFCCCRLYEGCPKRSAQLVLLQQSFKNDNSTDIPLVILQVGIWSGLVLHTSQH